MRKGPTRPSLLLSSICAAVLLGCGGSGGPPIATPVEPAGGGSSRTTTADPAASRPPSREELPPYRYSRYRPVGGGMFLVGLAPRGEKPWLIAFNARGRAVWWRRTRAPILQNQILPDGTVAWARSFRDGYGINPEMAHELHSLTGRSLGLIRTRGTVTDGHELQVTATGRMYLDSYRIRDDVDLRRFGGRPHASVADAEVQELGRNGRLLWRWNSRGRIGLGETGRWWQNNVLYNAHIVDGRKTWDPVHINSIDRLGDTVVISTRHTDAIYGISRRTKQILWKLGGTPTPHSLRVVGGPRRELLGGPHDARLHPGRLLSVYDDSTHRRRPPRASFFRLDLRRHEARAIGHLSDPLVRRSHCCGSVRPFEDGWLVGWGDNPLVTAFDREGRIAFRLHLASSSYRAVPLPSNISEGRLRRAMASSVPSDG